MILITTILQKRTESITKNSKISLLKQEMAGDLSVIPAGESFEGPFTSINSKWEIQYSRFFNFPRSPSSTSTNLRLLSKSKLRSGGTWLSCSSIAALQIVTDVLNPETILIVSLQGKIVEEHFTCNLRFTWPQVSCVSQCPSRGSRVVFASYRGSDGKIQKFGLRFATSHDAGTFIGTLKESLKDVMETGIPRSDFGSEVSSQSEFVSSNGLRGRDEELSFLNPIATYSPQMESILNYSCNQNKCSQESLLNHDFERVCQEDLPPSFTALLTNCSAVVERDQVKVLEEEAELKSQIMRYMSDSSFHEMLVKVEEVITEMGGDLAL